MNDTLLVIIVAAVLFVGFRMLRNVGTNKISQAKAKEMMDGDVIVLDVREKHEYSSGHIKNAVNLPLSKIRDSIGKVTKDKDKTLLIYCQSGARSASATRALLSMGYKNAHNFGGMSTWKY